MSRKPVRSLENADNATAGLVYTDAWKLERGPAATAWTPSSLDVREILLAVPSATGSLVDVAYPGGGTYGLMPPVGEAWLPLSFVAFVGSAVPGIGDPKQVQFAVKRGVGVAENDIFDRNADATTGWRASQGENDATNTIINDTGGEPQRLRIFVKQQNVTATKMMVSLRYLVYRK